MSKIFYKYWSEIIFPLQKIKQWGQKWVKSEVEESIISETHLHPF